MARVVPRKPTVTTPAGQQDPATPPPAESCRSCWRIGQREVFRLRCGHVYCGSCVTDLARVAMGAPTLLPLRCCQQSVPAAVLTKVLLAPELAFYQHLTAQGVDAKRQFVRDGAMTPLATPCDFCGQDVWLIGAQDAEKLLPCGHVYCDDCNAGLRRAAATGGHICCTEMSATATMDTNAVAESTPLVLPKKPKRIPRQAQLREGFSAVATAPAPTPTPGRGKRMAREAVIVTDDAVAKTNVCMVCSAALEGIKTAVHAPCGHALCRPCVKQRCARAILNEDEGSIGVPLRCCNQLVPVNVVASALGKKLLPKYETVVTKRADAVAAMPTPKAKAKAATRGDAKRQRVEQVLPTTEPPTARPKEPCVSCAGDMTAEAEHLRGPCGHAYCLTCMTMMARVSLDDRALVPIRCCGKEFPIEYVRRVLPKAKLAQYERFLAEKDWRTSDLKSDQEYARVVKKLGGKQCPACGVGVQKVLGCSTIHCPHGHVFCWTCGVNPCVCGARA